MHSNPFYLVQKAPSSPHKRKCKLRNERTSWGERLLGTPQGNCSCSLQLCPATPARLAVLSNDPFKIFTAVPKYTVHQQFCRSGRRRELLIIGNYRFAEGQSAGCSLLQWNPRGKAATQTAKVTTIMISSTINHGIPVGWHLCSFLDSRPQEMALGDGLCVPQGCIFSLMYLTCARR